MNPKKLRVRANRDDGTIWLTEENYRKPIRPVRDVTQDVLLALCADLSADGVTQEIERSVKFNDGMECLITVKMVQSSATEKTTGDDENPLV